MIEVFKLKVVKTAHLLILAFSFILFLRLLWGAGGVNEFQKGEERLLKTKVTLDELQKKNMALKHEIELIKKSPEYQRKVVREHLEVLGKDEFLVLFAKQ